jgi:hypothetical protein
MAEDDKECDCGDEIVLGPDLGDGTRPAIRHTADHRMEAGLVRQVKDGEPLPEDAMYVERIEGNRYSCKPALEHKGPSLAATPEYRNGWDRIFGGRQEVGQA